MEWWEKRTLAPGEWLQHLAALGELCGPVRGGDGVVRLQPLPAGGESVVALPRLSLKKYLLPPRETLWREVAGTFSPPEPPPARVVVGVAPCDLYGVAWLDRILADDFHYRRRRERLLLVGGECLPDEGCFCPPRTELPPFDLFDDGERLWSGSPRGAAVLAALPGAKGEGVFPTVRPWLNGRRVAVRDDLGERFAAAADAPLWRETAEHCLACGACSALCPTCSCFDMHDLAALDGSSERQRVWDNCFFPEHGLVAGGHNFRPDRAGRLRFRFEHKFLGFGPERGVASCVGCGRCVAGCPVGIDLGEIHADLLTRGRP